MPEPVPEQLLTAVAHPLRLAILVELEEHGERTPAELAGALGVERGVLEQHLAVLRDAGVVVDDAVPGRLSTPSAGWIELAARLRALGR
jgi:DNA-binding transcriptional ArsR family regulator